MNSRNHIHALVIAALTCLAFLSAAADTTDAQRLDQFFERSSLQIATPDARLHRFNIWIADSDARRARGLMFVNRMEPDAGMLFIYPQPQQISMWMKNTHVSLDMLFVAADGRVANIVENTQPMSLETIESGKEVTAVIELNAGTAARLRIGVGARVIHPAFGER